MNLKKRCTVLAAAFFALFGCVTANAVSPSGGLSVTGESFAPGDTFELSVRVPASENADSGSVLVEFDGAAFEAVTWEPVIEGGMYNSGDGFIVVSAANAGRNIDLSGGMVLTAFMFVKDTASPGEYTFELTRHSFTYVKDNGYEYEELWTPEITTLTVRVEGADTAQAATAASTTTAATSGEAAPAVTTNAPETTTTAPVTTTAAPAATTSAVSASAADPAVSETVKPPNPHTGVVIAVAVPCALVVCVLLARRISKHRKRTKKYIDE